MLVAAAQAAASTAVSPSCATVTSWPVAHRTGAANGTQPRTPVRAPTCPATTSPIAHPVPASSDRPSVVPGPGDHGVVAAVPRGHLLGRPPARDHDGGGRVDRLVLGPRHALPLLVGQGGVVGREVMDEECHPPPVGRRRPHRLRRGRGDDIADEPAALGREQRTEPRSVTRGGERPGPADGVGSHVDPEAREGRGHLVVVPVPAAGQVAAPAREADSVGHDRIMPGGTDGGPSGRARHPRRREGPGPLRDRGGAADCGVMLVELAGFEPATFSLRTRRATNCAIAPTLG